MIGSVVNLAAAMMQCGAGGIICDAGLCDATGGWAQFDPLPPIWLKAHERPVETYRLVEVAQAGPSTIVGRVRERRILEQHLDRLLGDGAGSVVIVEGEAGIGKSRLLADMMERAVSRSVRVVLARGDAIERSAPYHVWRRLFDTLLGPGGPGAAPEDRLIALLQPAPALAPFAPLLNPILGLNLEDNDRSRSATPQGRAALTRDLLVHLFSRAVGSQPTLLVLDDTHWFDSASWALTEGIERQLPQILVLIATRPVPQEDTPPELERIGARGTTSVLRLEALAGPEIRALVCQRLRSRRLDERVER
jgi:predicted ATPase